MSINSLQPTHFSSIFYYLQDSELKALGATSKRMHELVVDELKKRDSKMELLLSHSPSQTHGFTTTRQFNIQRLSEARLFGLGDTHLSEDCVADRSAFLAFLSRRAPVILVVEGIPSMEQCASIFEERFVCNNRSFVLIAFVAHEPFFQQNLYTIGWDIERKNLEEHEELQSQELTDIFERRKSKMMLLSEAASMSHLLPTELHTFSIWQQLGYTTVDQLKKDLSGESLYLGNRALLHFAFAFSHKLQVFVRNNLETISDELFDACKNYKSSFQSAMRLEDELSKKSLAFQRKEEERVRLEFSSRTASMVTTLQQIDSYRRALGIQEHFVVIEGGADHLEARKKGAEYDLSSLYQEFEHHKAAILLPMNAAIEERLIFQETQLPKKYQA